MKVKNDFPNVDSVLRKLKGFSSYFKDKKRNTQDIEELEDCEFSLSFVESFVNAIEKYLDCVCNEDMRIQKMRENIKNSEELKDAIQNDDNNRTRTHSEIITNMIMIDRMSDLYGLKRVFDYAEEFDKDYSLLTPSTIEEKQKMTERQRIKRREMGNFGLYIAAAVTAGVSREAKDISDNDLREFANCEGDNSKTDSNIFYRVKSHSHSLKRNVNIMLDDLEN